MARKRNAPALVKREGIECRLDRDFDAHSTVGLQCQYLACRGIPFRRAGLIASLAFGEVVG